MRHSKYCDLYFLFMCWCWVTVAKSKMTAATAEVSFSFPYYIVRGYHGYSAAYRKASPGPSRSSFFYLGPISWLPMDCVLVVQQRSSNSTFTAASVAMARAYMCCHVHIFVTLASVYIFIYSIFYIFIYSILCTINSMFSVCGCSGHI